MARFEALGLEGRRDEQRAELKTLFALADTAAKGTEPKSGAGWRARTLIAQSTLEWMLGNYAAAEATALEAQAIYHDLGDTAREAVALRRLGDVAAIRGDYSQAGHYYQIALARFRQSGPAGDRQGEVRTLNNLGIVYWGMGDYGAAYKCFSQALAIWRDLNDPQGQGVTLGNLGQIAGELGHYEQARDYYLQALALLQAVGDRHGQAIDLLNLGAAYGYLEDYTTAMTYYAQARDLFRAVGDRQSEGATLTYCAYTYLAQGAAEQAMACLEPALAIFTELQQRQWQVRVHAGLAIAHLYLSQLPQAWQAAQAALAEVAAGVQGVESLAEVYFRCAQVLAACGASDEAWDALDRAHKRLMTQADRIPDPDLRHDFLHRVHVHAEIIQTYETHTLKPQAGER